MKRQSLLAILALVVILAGFGLVNPAAGAYAVLDGTGRTFWDTHAVVIAEMVAPWADRVLKVRVTRVLSASFFVPTEMDLFYPIGGDNDLHKPTPGKLLLLVVHKDPRTPSEWNVPTYGLAFMPTQTAVVEINNEQDPRIGQVKQAVGDILKKAQEKQILLAKQAAEERFNEQINGYNNYWKSHTVVVAKLTFRIPGGPFAEIQGVLHATPAGPPAKGVLGFNIYQESLMTQAKEGRWVLMSVYESNGDWRIGGLGDIPGVQEVRDGVLEIKDATDPKITEIEKAIQGWQQHILDNAGAKPAAATPPPAK